MSATTYTPEMARALIDELDSKYRDAVKTGNLKKVISQERSALTALVKLTRESHGYPDIQRELGVPRYLWVFLPAWQALKHEKKLTDSFWNDQESALLMFDKKNPNHFRPLPVAPPLPSITPVLPKPVSKKPVDTVPPVALPVQLPVKMPVTKSPVVAPPVKMPVTIVRKQAYIPPVEMPVASTSQIPASPSSSSNAPVPSKLSWEVGTIKARRNWSNVNRKIVKGKKGKGKEKMVEEEDESCVEEGDEEEEKEEDEDEDEESPVPVTCSLRLERSEEKGKQKVVSDEEREESGEDTTYKKDPEYRRPSPKSNGKVMDPACQLCVQRGRVCYQRTGMGKACIYCAKMKMKCFPPGGDVNNGHNEVRVIVPAPRPLQPALLQKPARSQKPAQSKKPPPSQKPVTSQKPAVKRKLAPSRKQDPPQPSITVKRPPPPQSAPSDEASKKRRAPSDEAGPSKKRQKRSTAAAGSKKKVVKSPAKVDSSDSDDSDDNRPSKMGCLERLEHEFAKISALVELHGTAFNLSTENNTYVRNTTVTAWKVVEGLREQGISMAAKVDQLKKKVDEQERIIRNLEAQIYGESAPVAGPSAMRELSPPTFVRSPTLAPVSSPVLLPVLHDNEEPANPVPPSEPALPSPPPQTPPPQTLPIEPRTVAEPSPPLVSIPVAQPTSPPVTMPVHSDEPACLVTSTGTVQLPTPVVQPPPPQTPVVEPDTTVVDDTPAPLPSSDMPPPPLPLTQATVDMPSVQLLPPTPNTSQEAANYAPTTLLEVPAPTPTSDPPTSNPPSRSRSRSRSPVGDLSDLRRSPRLASPAPSAKRQAVDSLEEPVAKKQKGE